MNNFLNLGISKELVSLLNENRIEEPTPIQEQSIPQILNGNDIIGQAQTGTGKTLAFLLPTIENIDENSKDIQILVITPTRELALQITSEADKLKAAKELNILAAYGGKDVNKQIKKLKKNIHIVIGTPGRLLDHIRRDTIDLSKVRTLILDEADQMLEMGFLKDVEKIINRTPKNRQTLFFSATMPNAIRSLASRYMRKPIEIRIKSENITLDKIEQVIVETTDRNKKDELLKAIEKYRPFLAIIFCRTKRRVSDINGLLKSEGYDTEEIQGNLSQRKRERVMKLFRKAKIQFLVATDVAARGLDIDSVTHIFNYDIPEDTKSYIHRIGRTGRAGESGKAITFVTPKDQRDLRNIEKQIKIKFKKEKV
ncbi:DEAD/DEAH box helicase [Sporosalibacterium faouarense]|uniref:DEAD/DEAH box helicase n=1 Tax=Sporosalibacterium faouarense TaxID=516123 RepID=UPI00192A90BA|nr:DEAD/DEAH box helicase [Sporosalibacterium faouarense]